MVDKLKYDEIDPFKLNRAHFEHLPLEITEKILEYISPQDRLSTRLVSKKCQACVDYLFDFTANFKSRNVRSLMEKTRSGKLSIDFHKLNINFSRLNIFTLVHFHRFPKGLNVFHFDLTFIRELKIFCRLEAKTLEILLSQCPLISLLTLNGLAIAGGNEKLTLIPPPSKVIRDPNRDLKVSIRLEFYPARLKIFTPRNYMANLHAILSFPFIRDHMTSFDFKNIVTSDMELFYLSPDAIIGLLYASRLNLKQLSIRGNGYLPGLKRHVQFPRINYILFQIGCCSLPFAEWAFSQAENSKSQNAIAVFQQ